MNLKKIHMILFVVLTIVLVGCVKIDPIAQNDKVVEEKQQEDFTQQEGLKQDDLEQKEEAEQKEDVQQTDVINNGGLFVSQGDTVYYREYSEKNYEETGLFQTFEYKSDSKSNMMKVREGKPKEIIFEDDGNGIIYLDENRMFLETTVDYVPYIYTVNLDGSDKKEIGPGMILGMDEQRDTLVCVLTAGTDGTGEYQLFSVDTKTLEKKQYHLPDPYQQFLLLKDGMIYYTSRDPSVEGEGSAFEVCKISIDGTGAQVLATVKEDLYAEEGSEYGCTIPCVQLVEDILYFSYGCYAGTGYVYQGGKIGKVQTDGTGFELLDLGDSESLVGDLFYVMKQEDEASIYYNHAYGDAKTYGYSLTAQKSIEPLGVVVTENKPFELEGTVKIYQNAETKPTILIPQIEYDLLGEINENYSYTIKDIQLCGNYVYYRLEASEYDQELSIGWRDGYRRIKSVQVRNEIGKEEAELLFTY